MEITPKMPTHVSAVLACLILFTASCSVAPQKMIVGKWRDSDGDTTQFFPDGTVSISMKDGSITGKYSFPDKDHIKLEMSGPEASLGAQLGTYSVSSDVLKITSNGHEEDFQRAK